MADEECRECDGWIIPGTAQVLDLSANEEENEEENGLQNSKSAMPSNTFLQVFIKLCSRGETSSDR